MKLTPCTPTREMWEMLNDPREPNFDDFGPQTFEQFVEELAERRNFTLWSIDDGAGFIGYERSSPMTVMFRGLVIARAHRRKGLGRAAFEQIMAMQRDQWNIQKFLVMPFADNEPIHKLLLSLGFEQEGCIKGATMRNGNSLDISILGKEAA